MAKTLAGVLRRLGACPDAVRWAQPFKADADRAWTECERVGWMLWILCQTGADWRDIIRAVCDLVEPALVHIPAGEDRPAKAVAAARDLADGKIDTAAARAAAYAASVAAYAASAAARAAAYAAAYAAADAAADAAAYAARQKSLRESADTVRKWFPWEKVQPLWYSL